MPSLNGKKCNNQSSKTDSLIITHSGSGENNSLTNYAANTDIAILTPSENNMTLPLFGDVSIKKRVEVNFKSGFLSIINLSFWYFMR